MFKTEYIEKLVQLHKEMSNFAWDMDSVTKYSRHKTTPNYGYHSIVRELALKEIEDIRKYLSLKSK